MKKILLGLGIGLVAVLLILFGYSRHATTPVSDSSLGAGNISTVGPVMPNGLILGGIGENWASGQIGKGANQASFRNTTGGPIIIDLTEVQSVATTSTAQYITASSTYKIYVATSTASTIASDFVAPPYATVIAGYKIATTTGATQGAATTTTQFDSRSGTSVSFVLADRAYLNFQIQAADNYTCAQAGQCATATSSQRGFNLNWKVHYHTQ